MPSEAILPFSEEVFQNQESLINTLVAFLRRVDQAWAAGGKDAAGPEGGYQKEGLWLLAFLDGRGKVLYSSRPVDRRVLSRAGAVIVGKQDILIDIFGRAGGRQEKLRLIALRRAGGGTILAALDDAGLNHWGLRVAVQRAIEETVSMQGVGYVAVSDEAGALLGSLGEPPPDGSAGDPLYADILGGKIPTASRKIDLEKRNLLEVLAPLYLGTVRVGVVRVGLERERTDQIMRRNRDILLISLAFVIVIGLLSIWFLYQNQNRHLARIEEMRKQLEQSERLSALGQLAAGVAHEVRNPLNAISLASQRLQREFHPDDKSREGEFQHMTGVIRDEIRRLNVIIEDFLSFSRSRKMEFRNHSVRDLIYKIVSLIEEEARTRGISIRFQATDTVALVPMDVDKLQQALFNVIKNAMESIKGQGTVTISVEPRGGDWLAIRIADTGEGLTAAEMERIFDPEYTTKEKGLGLGLPIAHEIVRGHGGKILVSSTIGAGTTFEVQLPVKQGGA